MHCSAIWQAFCSCFGELFERDLPDAFVKTIDSNHARFRGLLLLRHGFRCLKRFERGPPWTIREFLACKVTRERRVSAIP